MLLIDPPCKGMVRRGSVVIGRGGVSGCGFSVADELKDAEDGDCLTEGAGVKGSSFGVATSSDDLAAFGADGMGAVRIEAVTERIGEILTVLAVFGVHVRQPSDSGGEGAEITGHSGVPLGLLWRVKR